MHFVAAGTLKRALKRALNTKDPTDKDVVVSMLKRASWSGKKNKTEVLASKFAAGEYIEYIDISDDFDQPVIRSVKRTLCE